MDANDRTSRFAVLRRTYLSSFAVLVLLLVVVTIANSQVLIWVCVSALVLCAAGFAVLLVQMRRASKRGG